MHLCIASDTINTLYISIYCMYRSFCTSCSTDSHPLRRAHFWQLRNLLNRSAVFSDPSTNVKVAEDFLSVIVHAFVVAAGEVIQKLSSRSRVQELAKAVVDCFVSLDLFTGPS